MATSRVAEPGQTGGIEPGGLRRDVPRAVRRAPDPSARPHQQRIARPHPQARPFLGGLEVLGKDRFAGFERVDAAYGRDVEEHAPGDNPVLQVVDPEAGGAVRGDGLGGVAVEELAFVEDVAQRVDVAGGEPVGRQGEVVRPPALGRGADHVVRHRGRVVGRRLGVEGPGTRDRLARTHGGRGGGRDLGSDQVQRAELVVGPPASPVGETAVQSDDVSGGHRVSGHGTDVSGAPLRSPL